MGAVDECEHGDMRRKCELCERDAEIEQLRARVENYGMRESRLQARAEKAEQLEDFLRAELAKAERDRDELLAKVENYGERESRLQNRIARLWDATDKARESGGEGE